MAPMKCCCSEAHACYKNLPRYLASGILKSFLQRFAYCSIVCIPALIFLLALSVLYRKREDSDNNKLADGGDNDDDDDDYEIRRLNRAIAGLLLRT